MLQRIKRKIPLLLIIGSLILSACAMPVDGAQTPAETLPPAETPETPTESPAPTPELEDTAWALVSIGETPAIAGSRVTLIFEAGGQAGGLGGCNSYGASYQIEGDSIAFEPVTSTLMACEPSEIMEQEAEFFAALGAASSFELAESQLIIHYDDGQGALHFVPAEDAESEPTARPERTDPAASETPELITERLCDPASDPSMPAWTVCHSQRFGFEVLYPQEAELTDQTATTVRFDLPFTAGTNLTEKYMEVAVVEGADDCTSPMAEGSPPESILVEPVEIEGLPFLRQMGMGAAAGNRYDWLAYSTEQGDRCVSLGFVLHSFDPELMPTPPPVYDVEVEAAVFEEIVKTFRWLEASEGEDTLAAERITFTLGGTSAEVPGSLPASGSDLYVIRALEGQMMTVDLTFTQGRAILAVWGEDGTVLMSDHAEASRFSQALPSTQDYYIQLKGSPESATEYRLTVNIPPDNGQSGQETPAAERIVFEPGKTAAERSGSLPTAGADLYVINAMKDQTMHIDLTFTTGRAIIVVWGADGTVLMSDHAEASNFSGVLPSTQDYYVHLKGHPEQATEYRLTVTIPPLDQ